MGEIDEHDDKPSNTLEYFVEQTIITDMIKSLKTENNVTFEKSYEVFSAILGKYQEQPHLLNPHLQHLIDLLLMYIRDPNSDARLLDAAFKYMYQFSKVRSYKVFVKYLPHEISDLHFVVKLLEKQPVDETVSWETRYMLILWLSILVLNPFEMSRFDSVQASGDTTSENSIMERIFILCKINTANNDTCSDVAAFLTSKYLIRIDIKEKYLPKYLNWVMETEKGAIQFGQLAAISATLKYGKREDLLPYATILLKWLLTGNFKSENDFLKNKFFIKIIQRIGLVLLKPRLALWRYQRGSRSLAVNLSSTPGHNIEFQNNSSLIEGQKDEDIFVPQEIEDVLEELLQGLRNASSDIRWLAAKGIGRICNRLPKDLGDEVVGSVTELLNPLEPNEAWHGACLAIAELAKRGLLLPYRLETMVPLLLQALVYDELKGYMSVGQHIRDAACYMCWAFARAYEPIVLKPFINKIAAGLLVTTVFDREINCRRAASAAFQESVGRLRNFPHGIDILTKADFFSVGIRTHSFLEISDFIAQYDDYSYSLIDHLVAKKTSHWDTAIRELTAKALKKLTAREPDYMVNNVIPKLFSQTISIDVNARHGSILAIGEITSQLKALELENNCIGQYISEDLNHKLNNLIYSFQQRDQYKGLSGEMMFQSSCDFIKNCSLAKIHATDECLASWQTLIDTCLTKNSTSLRECAITALRELCPTYYNKQVRAEENRKILENYLTGSKEDLWEFVRMGYVSAIGVLPKVMVVSSLHDVFITLMAHSLAPRDRIQFFIDEPQTEENQTVNNWSEARRESVKALSNVVQTVGFEDLANLTCMGSCTILEHCFQCFLKALQEYTIDNRGDIGAWVREAAMNALYRMITTCPHHFLRSEIVHAILCGFLQQAVEKIDRTRALAGKLFCKTIYSIPAIPYIKHHEFIKTIFPEDNENILWLHAAHTFPLFCQLLVLPEYTKSLIIGLIASIGQLTESLIKHASQSLCQFLRSHPNHKVRVCNVIVDIFKNNLLNERITCPLLNFLNAVISSGAIDNIVLDPASQFSSEIYRLTKLEIKGHKKLYKLVSSINVFCQLIQVPELSSKILSTLSVFLGLPHVHVRKCTATRLYEALILHADACGISEEKLDFILNCLSETDWAQPVTEIRPIRNNLCISLGIKPPVITNPNR